MSVVKCRIFAVAALFVALSTLAVQAQTGAPYGSRDPATCDPLRLPGAPKPEQAAQSIRCQREQRTASDELWLMENVKVDVGPAQPFRDLYNVIAMPEADTTKPVHPISGAWTWLVCRTKAAVQRTGGDGSRNCRASDVTGASGACWQTRAGEWRCFMNGSTGPSREAPPPLG